MVFGTAMIYTENQNQNLVSVFPNPTSYSTCFSYLLPYSMEVQIVIYDRIGGITDNIRLKQDRGSNQYVWNVEEVPPGIYFYMIIAGLNSESGKIIIVK